MTDAPAPENGPMQPSEALAAMANVTRLTGALRLRLEGLTLVIWGLCMSAAYLTLAVPILGGGRRGGEPFPRPPPGNGTLEGHLAGPPPTAFFFNALAPLVWFALAAIITIVLWRTMSISFQTGVTTPRILGTMVAWLLTFVVVSVLLTYVEGGNPRAWHLLVWALVMGLFALLNPLRFGARSRWAGAAVAGVMLVAGAYALVANLDGRDTTFLTGLATGLPMLVAGLYLMVKG